MNEIIFIMRKYLLLIIISATALAYWLILFFNIPLIHSLFNWFWFFKYKVLTNWWLLILNVIIIPIFIKFILKNKQRYILNIILLVLLGYFIQLSYAFLEGRGIDPFKNRLTLSGHSEYTRLAVNDTKMYDVAWHYEELLKSKKLGQYPNTKPPGALLFYMGFEGISSTFTKSNNIHLRYNNYITMLSWFFPLLSYLVLFPLFFLSKIFLSTEESYLTCLLYLFIPSTILITMHLDQVLYPALFITSLYLGILSFTKKSMLFGFLTGVVVYFSLYFSFSIISIIPLVILLGLMLYIGNDSLKSASRDYFKIIVSMMVGFFIFYLIFIIIFQYDFFKRFENAFEYHQTWKAWKTTFKRVAYFSFLNYLEFACWIGFPVFIIFILNSILSIKKVIKKSISKLDLLSLSLLIVFVLLALFGNTRAETARLWLFFVPLICMFVISELKKRFPNKFVEVLQYILFLQLITALFIKAFQDF